MKCELTIALSSSKPIEVFKKHIKDNFPKHGHKKWNDFPFLMTMSEANFINELEKTELSELLENNRFKCFSSN